MIGFPSGVRVWLASGRTDMRKGFAGLALLVQEGLKHDPPGGNLCVFRGRRSDLVKIIWHGIRSALSNQTTHQESAHTCNFRRL